MFGPKKGTFNAAKTQAQENAVRYGYP